MSTDHTDKRFVYNLQFPSYCNTLSIDGYVFSRAPDYEDRFKSLHHVIPFTNEFRIDTTLGIHACTATVQLFHGQKDSVIPWTNEQDKPTALDDILLLLSLFTGRDVFWTPKLIGNAGSYTDRDPRAYYYDLGISIPYKPEKDMLGPQPDVGFGKGINEIYSLMKQPVWQQQYANGRFLPLFRSACRRNGIETSFITCWTIWEHLFALHKQKSMSKQEIRRFPVADKISFVAVQYSIKDSLRASDQPGIKRFAEIRNTLVHAGGFPDPSSIKDAVLFVRVTCMIVARILGRSPPDVLGTQYMFSERLAGRRP